MQPPRGGETGTPTRVLLPTAPLTTSWAALQHRAQSRTATLGKQELGDVTVAENYSKSIYQESGAELFSMVPRPAAATVLNFGRLSEKKPNRDPHPSVTGTGSTRTGCGSSVRGGLYYLAVTG